MAEDILYMFFVFYLLESLIPVNKIYKILKWLDGTF